MKKYVIVLVVALLAAIPVASTAAPPQQGEDYVIQADDWLSKLADKFLDDPLAYPAITYYTNQKNIEDDSFTLITDSDRIEVGQKIYIPTPKEVETYFAAAAESLGQGEIKIGALAPLSAPGSVSGGTAMKTAFEIALEEINAAGGVLGRQVGLALRDTEGLAERGAAAMDRLINQEAVVGVVGAYHSPVGLAAKEVAAASNTPTIFAGAWHDALTADQEAPIFRIGPLASEVAVVEVNFIQSLGAEYVVIVTGNSDYGIPAADNTAERLSDRDIEAEIFPVEPGNLDFAPLIERLKTGRMPDAILVLLTGDASFAFQQQAAAAGIGPQEVIMICDQAAADSEAFWQATPDGELCFYRRIGLPRQLWTGQTAAFADRYREKTGKAAPESFAMAAYDSLKLMAQAINEAGSTESEAIIAALENITYDGALGTITFPYGLENPVPEDMAAKWWHQFPEPAVTIVQYTEKEQADAAAVVVFPEAYQTGEMIRPPGGDN